MKIAYTPEGDFIAGCTIKHCDTELAKVGFMLVDRKYRQMGLGEHLTKLRINYAQQLGIKMLYAKVRGQNIAIVSQINNFPIELVKLCSNGKVFPHFFHNTNHFAGILHISIKSMHNRVM